MEKKLEVTNVKIFMLKNEPDSKVKARASIVFNDCFRVSGIKVIEGEKGLFASLPKYRDDDGNFWQTAAPLNREMYQTIQDEIVHAYVVKRSTGIPAF